MRGTRICILIAFVATAAFAAGWLGCGVDDASDHNIADSQPAEQPGRGEHEAGPGPEVEALDPGQVVLFHEIDTAPMTASSAERRELTAEVLYRNRPVDGGVRFEVRTPEICGLEHTMDAAGSLRAFLVPRGTGTCDLDVLIGDVVVERVTIEVLQNPARGPLSSSYVPSSHR